MLMQKDKDTKKQKKKWEKPVLVNLDVAVDTKGGFFGAINDGTNTVSGSHS